MKKKSLFDIAMEQKREKQNNKNNVFAAKKNSKISIVVEIIAKIFRIAFYIVICILLTIGTTVLVNSELRQNLISILKLNF